jgi:GxxExxY protein
MEINDITYQVIGAAMEVHKELGPGFLEAVYQEALAIEMKERGINFIKENKIKIKYKSITLSKYYNADFVCESKLLLELKATQFITDIDKAQAINYLKATGYNICLILNFGSESLEYKRIVYKL